MGELRMTEYIKRDEAIKMVKELFSVGDCYCDKQSIVGHLNAMTAADVQEVKHAEWRTKECDDGWGTYILYWCSECGSESARKHKYCRDCGAEMNLGKD